jgi:excisionase family DNA binding protein
VDLKGYPLLDVRSVAAMLNVAPKTVYRWAEARLIPSVKCGSRLRFSQAAIKRFVSDNTRAGRQAVGA